MELRPPEERARLQGALRAVLKAADGINAQDRSREDVPESAVSQHNGAMKQELLDAWEKLAHAAGYGLLAIRLGREQPIVPFQDLQDPIRALGVAAFHAGSAVMDFGLIQHPGTQQPHQLEERYQDGDQDARMVHLVLHVINEELAGRLPSLSKELRKYARQMDLWVTRERALAAQSLGLEPVPWATGRIDHHDINHLQKQRAAVEQMERASGQGRTG